uniref:Uncharacterized protein n=1 Tax=Anguilla anguilla TaxID=7936 RepID=A0A0E9SK57_ANGAN
MITNVFWRDRNTGLASIIKRNGICSRYRPTFHQHPWKRGWSA